MAVEPNVDATTQERTGRQDDARCIEANAHLRHNSRHRIVGSNEIVACALENEQIRLRLDAPADGRLVEQSIRLRTCGPYSGAFRPIEDPEVDPGLVRCGGHGAAERVDLLDQMALADPADRRVAAHLAERLDGVRQQQSRCPHARRGERSLGAGMTATDNDHVEMSRKKHRRLWSEAAIVFFRTIPRAAAREPHVNPDQDTEPARIISV